MVILCVFVVFDVFRDTDFFNFFLFMFLLVLGILRVYFVQMFIFSGHFHNVSGKLN